VSHEFFHVWNVKRLRPAELGPFDYENENYTRSLWVAEGFTEYYGSLIAVRAGVITRDEYLAVLSTEIETLQTTPGRFTRPVDLASFDAWIRAYRPDENSINATISYYTKGAVIAFLFDAQLRIGGASLDDLMRNAYQRYPNGFPETAFTDRFEWLRKAVTTTSELDYAQALDCFGLRFKTPASTKSTLGITTKVESGRLIVAKVPHGIAGFSADDEILAIDGYRLLPGDWTERVEHLPVDVPAEFTVSRRGRLTTVTATPTLDPGKRWSLEVADLDRVNAWLEQTPQP
jgi:predicted metalloprotease with PDZ domain